MSRQSHRDEVLERLLRESLGARSRAPQAGACPDAETLAAWIDGSLAGVQLTAAQEHAADCVACQATLAALARTAPPSLSAEPWWQRGLSARWLVPLAATATALAVWVAVPRDEYSRPPEQATTTAVSAAAPEGQTVPQTEAASEPAATGDKRAADARSVAPQPTEQPASEVRLDATQKAAPADAGAGRRDAARQDGATATLGQSDALAPQASAAAAAPAEARQERPSGAPPAPRAEAPARQPAAPAAAPARSVQAEALMERTNLAAQRVEILSPGGASRWRIGPAGSVEYSADAGATWEATASGVTADLTAGASPSGTVCWIVGRAGTVLLTTDGRQWRRVTSPVAADLAAVEATDARTATVSSADGRRFRTVDGGATWERL